MKNYQTIIDIICRSLEKMETTKGGTYGTEKHDVYMQLNRLPNIQIEPLHKMYIEANSKKKYVKSMTDILDNYMTLQRLEKAKLEKARAEKEEQFKVNIVFRLFKPGQPFPCDEFQMNLGTLAEAEEIAKRALMAHAPNTRIKIKLPTSDNYLSILTKEA